MTKMIRVKKLLRVFRRKWLKPLVYASIASMLTYIIVGDVVIRKYSLSSSAPHFVISHIDERFDKIEYMHMLLTIQEINKTVLKHDLKKFVNSPFPAQCPKYLKMQLYKMNWEPAAFQIRVQKLSKMYEIYDQVARLEETIAMLAEESMTSSVYPILYQQIRSLETEKNRIIENSLTKAEYEFIKEYGGVVPSLQILEEK